MIIEFNKKNFPLRTPFLLRHGSILSLTFFVIAVASCIFIDEPLIHAIHSFPPLAQEWFLPFHLFNQILAPESLIILLPSFLFLVHFLTKAETLSRRLWLISSALALSLLITKLIAFCVGKSTPEWFFLHEQLSFRPFQIRSSFHSFPSSVSCCIGVLGSCLSYLYPKSSKTFFTVSLILAMSPVLAVTSFLSDSILGYYLGAITSLFVFRIMRKEVSFF